MSNALHAKGRRAGIAVLAAGSSKRFGKDKLFAPLAGRPLLAHCLETISALEVECLVVTSACRDVSHLLHQGQSQTVNEKASEGPGTSLGIAAAWAERLGLDALGIMLGDMPFVQAPHMQSLLTLSLQGYRAGSSYGDNDCRVPATFPNSDFLLLQALDCLSGARALVRARGTKVVKAKAGSLYDVDTPRDLCFARQRLHHAMG